MNYVEISLQALQRLVEGIRESLVEALEQEAFAKLKMAAVLTRCVAEFLFFLPCIKDLFCTDSAYAYLWS